MKVINLTDHQRVEVQVTFNLPSNLPPGSYTSNIHVTSSTGSTLDVPVSIKISASEWLMGGLILFGVFFNLALFFIKDMVDDRNNLRNILHDTESLLSDAYNIVNRAYRQKE